NDHRLRGPRGYRARSAEGGRMSKLSGRQLIAAGALTAAGAGGLAVAAKLAHRYGLVPPDSGGIYGPGATLTYAAQRLLTRHSMAREFSRSQISATPFANEVAPLGEEFRRFEEGGFADWRGAGGGEGGASPRVFFGRTAGVAPPHTQ